MIRHLVYVSALALAGLLAAAPPISTAPPLFVESASAVGLDFVHVNGATGEYYMAEQMGAGAALLDYDGDGDLDVFLVQGGPLGVRPGSDRGQTGVRPGSDRGQTPPPDSATSRLFRNDLDASGRLRFTDVTHRAGVELRAYGMGAAVADYNGDGHADLLVTAFGKETLYRNNGNGTFSDVTADAGVGDDLWSTSASFLDYDRDGHLDLFVANYLDFTVATNKTCFDSVGARDYCSPRAYRPVPARLYRNLGNGRFADVSESTGISRTYGAGLGVVAGDYNRDGWLDIYVANDATPNQLWMNARNGTFKDEGMISGAAVNAAGNPEGSMGIASGDADLDGDEDLFITNIIAETFAYYENDGRGNFEDARARVGLAAPTAGFTGFGADWIDYDNDGLLDLFVANGAVNIVEAQRGQPTPFRMRNQLFRNTGKGRFEETSSAGGPAFARAEIGRGAAFGDIDNDGDVDILVTNNGGPVRLLVNQSPKERRSLQVTLEAPPPNRAALGAWVGVERTGQPTLWRRVKTDGSYLAASDPRLHFGVGSSGDVSAILVHWPDGQRERFTGIKSVGAITLRRGQGRNDQ